MLTAKENEILEVLEAEAGAHGCEIVTLSIVGPANAPILRVYVDAQGGVSFDELASAQAWISPLVEGMDPFVGAYTLEVSSPGVDRPLRTLEHFERFVGEKAHIRAQKPVQERKNFNGVLKGVSANAVKIEVDGEVFEVDLDNIKRANLICEF